MLKLQLKIIPARSGLHICKVVEKAQEIIEGFLGNAEIERCTDSESTHMCINIRIEEYVFHIHRAGF